MLVSSPMNQQNQAPSHCDYQTNQTSQTSPSVVNLPVDVSFPLEGGTIPLDHGYSMYAALSNRLEILHDTTHPVYGVHPIRGKRAGQKLLLTERSRLKIRCDSSMILSLLQLIGEHTLEGHRIRVCPPSFEPLQPWESLTARIVTIHSDRIDGKGPIGSDAHRTETALVLADRVMEMVGNGANEPPFDGIRVGAVRGLRIKSTVVNGYGVQFDGLTPEASLALQAHGLGGRRRMGAGVFV